MTSACGGGTAQRRQTLRRQAVARIGGQGPGIEIPGFAGLAFALGDLAQAIIGIFRRGIVGGERGQIIAPCIFKTVLAPQGVGAIVEGGGRIGDQPQHGAIIADRIVQPVHAVQHQPPFQKGARLLRLGSGLWALIASVRSAKAASGFALQLVCKATVQQQAAAVGIAEPRLAEGGIAQRQGLGAISGQTARRRSGKGRGRCPARTRRARPSPTGATPPERGLPRKPGSVFPCPYLPTTISQVPGKTGL